MYRLFYNYQVTGDVLFVVFESETIPDETLKKGNAVALFKDKKLIGYNIFDFSNVVKLKTSGMLVTPDDALIEAVNSILLNAGFEKLPYCRDSGYRIAEVKKVEEHPLDEKKRILTLDVGAFGEKVTTTRYEVKEGDLLVLVLDKTIKFDGTTFHESVIKNIPQQAEIMSGKDLLLNEEGRKPFLVEGYKAGDDFFLGGAQ